MYERQSVLRFIEKDREFLNSTVPENIEKHRKGEYRLQVCDKNGKPLPFARVRVEQKSHQFKFGANLFMLDELETEEKNRIYKRSFANLFNMATLPFYWNTIEPERGHFRYEKGSSPYYRRPPIDLCIEFCRENNIEPREHALAYEHHFPSWLKGASTEEVKSELTRRFEEIATRYADKIPTIEVTNEMFWWKGITDFYDEDDYVEWCFKEARRFFPNNQLVVNEAAEECWCDVRRSVSKYYSYIKNAMQNGAEIDAIGLQYHAFYDRAREIERANSLYHPTNIYAYLDFYARLINRLQITEITIPAYSEEPKDEEIQAELLETLYRVWFSHPAMEQIIYWNLVDGYAYVENPTPERIRQSQGDMTAGENVYRGGLLRFDMTPKPAYLRLCRLINEEWHTCLDLVADEDGYVSFRGFYGDYELSVPELGITEKFTLKSK